MNLKDLLLPTMPLRVGKPATFGSYLWRPPLRHLLPLIALAIAIRLAIATLLAVYEPNLPVGLNYIMSAATAVAIALAAAYLLYRRMA